MTNFAETGVQRADVMRRNPLGFWIICMMAGVYVGFGILLIFSLGSLMDPSVRPLAMGASFGLALIPVVFAGADLFTGSTMSVTLAVLERRARAGQLLGVWVTSWFGNLAIASSSSHPAEITWAGAAYNLFWVTIGNVISGVVFMAAAPWVASGRLVPRYGRIQPQAAE